MAQQLTYDLDVLSLRIGEIKEQMRELEERTLSNNNFHVSK